MGLVTPEENDYLQARALMADAMRRRDQAAIDVAASLYRDALSAIKRTIPDPRR